jgi:hypothetical protein
MSTAYVPDVPSRAGITPTVNTPATSGDTFPAGDGIFLRLITAGTPTTITVTPQAAGGPRGSTVAPYTFTTPATGVREIGPFPSNPYANSSGLCSPTYSSITGLTVECKNYVAS